MLESFGRSSSSPWNILSTISSSISLLYVLVPQALIIGLCQVTKKKKLTFRRLSTLLKLNSAALPALHNNKRIQLHDQTSLCSGVAILIGGGNQEKCWAIDQTQRMFRFPKTLFLTLMTDLCFLDLFLPSHHIMLILPRSA